MIRFQLIFPGYPTQMFMEIQANVGQLFHHTECCKQLDKAVTMGRIAKNTASQLKSLKVVDRNKSEINQPIRFKRS